MKKLGAWLLQKGYLAGDAAEDMVSRGGDAAQEPLLVTAHMDTVVPCDHVSPVLREGVIYSDGTSILGADDKAGVAAIFKAGYEEFARQQSLGGRTEPEDALAAVQPEDDGLWGFIDPTGEVVIATQFQSAGWFSNGLAEVMLPDGRYAYIDVSGRIVWSQP